MKLISLLENFGKCIAVSLILMYLLNHKNVAELVHVAQNENDPKYYLTRSFR